MLFREEGEEGNIDVREKHWSVASRRRLDGMSHARTGDGTLKPGMCPD